MNSAPRLTTPCGMIYKGPPPRKKAMTEAASLNRIEHQPSKLRVAGSSPATSPIPEGPAGDAYPWRALLDGRMLRSATAMRSHHPNAAARVAECRDAEHRSAARIRSTYKLIPTRVKADSFWGFQTGASQTLWW